jgi:very-short-patch-repair endonuclease
LKDRIYKKPFRPYYTKENARRLRKNSTPAEEKLWGYLKNRGFMNLKFRRQVPYGRFILDFYCKDQNLVVELDGEYHNRQRKYDKKREEELKAAKMRICRFKNEEVLFDIEVVLRSLEELVI